MLIKVIKLKDEWKKVLKNRYFYAILLLDIATCILRFALTKTYSTNFVMESMCMVMLAFMSAFAFIDREYSVVPNQLLLIALVTWLIMIGGYVVVAHQEGFALLLFSLGGAFLGGMMFLVCYFLSKKQLGGGDVKLAFVIGLFMTTERVLPVIIYGTLACCLFSIVLLIMKKTTLKSLIPLVPFLHLGLCITLILF